PALENAGTSPFEIQLAPWSGLLVNEQALPIVASQETGYFFGRDDSLLCCHLREQGFRIIGVPQARLYNKRRGEEYLAPWRAYYGARNHVLFCRDTGSGLLSKRAWRAGLLWAKFFYGALVTGRPDRAVAIARGVF